MFQGYLRWGFRHCDLALREITFYLDCLTPEEGIDRLFRNVCNKVNLDCLTPEEGIGRLFRNVCNKVNLDCLTPEERDR